MEPKSKFIKANGIRHHYLEWGSPDRRPLLMLHATGLCASPWQPVARELAREFHVMALDQRGHGETDPSDCGYSFHLVGQDLAAVIQELGLSELSIIGHSSGGLAALMADSLLPGGIRRALLVETRVGGRPDGAPPQELQERAQRTRMKRAVWESRAAMYQGYRTRAAFKDWMEDAFTAFIEGGTCLLDDGRAALRCPPDVEATFYETRDALNVEEYLGRGLQGRYLLLLGNYPGCQTLTDYGVRRFLELVRYSQVKPVGRGSHFLPMEYPDLVLEEARAFFD